MRDSTIYVIDDDIDLANSLARLLDREGYHTASFADPDELKYTCEKQAPHCVVTDVMMGQHDGFEVARAIKATDPTIGFIFMTAWPKSAAAVDAVRNFGGTDYLSKPINEARLFEAIALAISWSKRQRTVRTRLAKLTSRELEVFHLLCRGMSNKMIAAELGIHPKTIEDHRASIMRKTGSVGLAQLIELERML